MSLPADIAKQQLPAVVVEVMEAVADTIYLTLAQEFDVTQVPQRSVTLESSCCPEATSVFLAANSPPSCPSNLSAVRSCTRHNT